MSQIVQRVMHFAQPRLLWLLLCAYALAWLGPGPGLRVRAVRLGSLPWVHGEHVEISLPLVMLALLLANAGFAIRTQDLGRLTRYLKLLGVGLLASALMPMVFALAVASLGVVWRGDALQSILVGLALVGSMPIAGSSTAWSQNAGGNLVLSLGLVLVSTLSSPLLGPLALHLVGYLAQGDYAEDLHELALHGSSGFLVYSVVVPSLLGLLAQGALGARARTALLPSLRLVNLVDLLVLNYSNASSALPVAFRHPDWTLLLATIAVTASLCVLGFGLGALIGRGLGAASTDRLALMFALGMSNNGMALVLASVALGDHPEVMVPIIFYNLAQQIVAGVVDARSRRGAAASSGPGPRAR